METRDKKILVTGATGQQGGAVARQLLDAGFQVLALTRDPSKPAARDLTTRGAQVVRGDLNDPESIGRIMEGCHGVFSVQNFWETGYDREIQQGCDLADEAKRRGIKHFIYSSVGGADRNTGLTHFESKWQIEQHIQEIGLPCTVLRPVFFMENFQNYLRDQILGGTLPQPLDPDRPLQMISVEDIGIFARLALELPEQWLGQAVELAGDEPTMTEVATIFSRVLGRQVSYVQVPWDTFHEMAGAEMAEMYRWFNDFGYEANIHALRKINPHLLTLEQVLRSENWRMRMTA